MQAQLDSVAVRPGLRRGLQDAAAWFIPASIRHSRTHRGLAQVFVQSHLLLVAGGLLMIAYLVGVSAAHHAAFYIMCCAVMVFAALPFALRLTGNIGLVTLVSFQALTVASLVGTYGYGGFASPFLPWLLVSLLSGLFYQSRRASLVIGLFAFDVAALVVVLLLRSPTPVSPDELPLLSWVSIAVAMAYMAFMALYYSRIIASRDELAAEAERHRIASVELEQARAVAEKVGRNRTQFFAKMSHELRTPLNVVINYSEMLLEDYEADAAPGDQRAADLRRINVTGKHLLSLVSDVFDMETVERSELKVDMRNFTLGELCDAVVATTQPLVEKNGNQLVVVCPLRSDTVSTDDTKLRQMLLNLMSNAAKFTQDGTVTLELWVERGLADDRLHAAVRDTGMGIATDVLPNLFETYMQADASVSGRFGGTGIGLALTRKFAVLLGGQISVVSSPGQGSSFIIDIPADLRARPAEAADGTATFDAVPSRSAEADAA